MNENIKNNASEISNIKKSLNFQKLFVGMEKRVIVLEKLIDKILYGKNRKGQTIDPRIIFWILLIILLFLFLKSIGFFG